MKRKIAFALAALSILLVLTATANSAVAAPLPGVKAGDTADYKVVGYPAYNTTHITVWGTNGAYVALTATNYKVNGTLYSVSYRNWSVASFGGSSWRQAVFLWVVSKNLTVGPGEILGATPGVFVRNNLTMTAAGVSRFVLHANGSAGFRVPYFDMYFDRETGLVVQGNYDTQDGWINVTLTSTNVWSGGLGGLDAVALLAIGEGAVIVVLFVAMVFFAARARKHRT